ncbi:hypothetical protein DPMN_088053 [Dreissena polymorpha]|uniref:Uncharacterized protein n=1 Tax=Dreissena polymorpha TaxID=45954 RepID=A0A9D4KTG0_DREPO|nr:hypothetical protein DPMN_088053 [Dreissena polymorpha]
MSTDGGLKWYWIVIIIFAVIAVSGCIFLIWCFRRPKLPKQPQSPVPTSPSPSSSFHRHHPLPESPGLYRPSDFRPWSHSLTSLKSDADHPLHRPHSLPENPGLYRPSLFRQGSHSSHESDTDHPHHRPHPLPESPGIYRPFRHSLSSQKSDPGHHEANVPFIPFGP